jgi:pre-mRNA-splicing factor 38A
MESLCRYLRALAAMYIRMTFRPVDVYELLEPLLKDYRKLRLRNMCRSTRRLWRLPSCIHSPTAGYSLTFMDEFIDQLLTQERVCDTILPRLTRRDVLEETEGLPPRPSALMDAMEGATPVAAAAARSRSRSPSRSKSRSPSRSRSRSRSKTPLSDARDGDRYVSRSPSRSGSSYQSRSRSISPDRMDIEGDPFEPPPGVGALEVDVEVIPGDV